MTETTTEDRSGGFLQPDAILPTQFFQSLRSKGYADGERRLMVAVLEDAVNCFMKQVHATDPKARQLFADAEAWIATEDRTWFFSFDNVCETLDLSPEYLREGLLEWRAAERRRADDARVAAARASVEAAASGMDSSEPDVGHGHFRLVRQG